MVNKAELKRKAAAHRELILVALGRKEITSAKASSMLGPINKAESRQEEIPEYYSTEVEEQSGD